MQWTAFMVIIYIAFAWYGWDRTLIPDEIWALAIAERPWLEWIASIRGDLVHPPLIYVLQRAWVWIFGFSDFTAKALPVLINVLSIGLFTLLAFRVTTRWRLASFLFLTVYLHVFAAPNLARMYGLLLLLTIASILAWDQWRRRPTFGRLASWTAIMSLAVMTHYFGVLLLASFVLLEWLMGLKPRTFTLAAMIPALLFGAWAFYVYPIYADHGLEGNLRWVEPSLVRAMAIVPFHFLTTVPSGSNPVHAEWWAALPAMRLLVAGAAAVPLLLAALAFWSNRSLPVHSDWLVPLVVLGCAPAVLLAGVSLLVGPAFDSRFLLGSLPVYWLLIVALADLGGKPGGILLVAVILPVALASVILPLRHDLAESPLRRAVTLILHDRKPGDVVLADNQTAVQAYWELRRAGANMPVSFVPALRSLHWFAPPLTVPDRIWVFCRGGCNDTIRGLLRQHVAVLRYGRYLTLFERS